MNGKIVKFEYDALRIDEDGFREPHFQRLVQYNERHGNRYFVVGNRKIIFQNYVGVIRVGSLTIEILPKIGRVAKEKKDEWQKILIEMLQRSGELKLSSVG